MGRTLYEKVFERHAVRRLPSGQYQLLMGLHLIHEVTSPQAFAMLRERGLKVKYPHRTFATVDHIIPTDDLQRPLADSVAEEMLLHLERNCQENGITFFGPETGEQGIVHIIGPEKGLTQPGMTICCGDSHTATHGALGALAFGIGTSQVADVLATQTLAMDKLKVRRIEVTGTLSPGVYAKDVVLHLVNKLGVKGGVGYAYEYAGGVFDAFSMEERLTVCNMSIEGGARCGYVNPDETTFEFLQGRDYAPGEDLWEEAVAYWRSLRSDPDAAYDDTVRFAGADIEPMVTWGITPGQSVAVTGSVPAPDEFPEDERDSVRQALAHMKWQPGQPLAGTRINVAFIGSCTNGNVSDFAAVAQCLAGGNHKVASHVRALIVPGSQRVHRELVARGYDELFRDAGFQVRLPGCSLCLAMNPDKLQGDELSASTSNRNFKGRQGSPTGRTLLMSPVMAAAAAVAGEVVDARELFQLG